MKVTLVGALAVVWLALVLPHVATRYSYDWDSSQFERGVAHFDIVHHQPHPPGYPLWILVSKALTPLTGQANYAQVILAVLFTLAGLAAFFSLAREALGEQVGMAAAAMLAFSPVVMLYAMTPLTYAVDLFTSCMLAWMAARLWRGEVRWAPVAFAVAAVTAGFRPSGAAFLLPLLCVALWRCWRKDPRYAAGGLLAGAVLALAWYVPTARLSGGLAALAAIGRAQMMSAGRSTSVLFGAPLRVHASMVVDMCLYFSIALAPLALPVVISWGLPRRSLPAWASPLFFALWLGPNLAVLTLFHCGRPGYILLSLPALVLLGAWLASRLLELWQWIVVVAAAGLAAGYFPYQRFINPATPTAVYQLLKASPRMPALLESAQHQLRGLIDAMPGRPQEKLVFCLLRRTEAPNIRTVTYEYPDVYWADGKGQVFPPHDAAPLWSMPPSVRSLAWLCDGAGLPPDVRTRFPAARRVAGNALFSFWTAGALP